MKPKTLNLIQVNLAVLIWAGTSMFAKGIELPTIYIIFWRSVVAAAVLFAFLRLTGTPIGIRKKSHFWLMLISGLLLCGHWLTYFQALKDSSAAVAILSLHTYPVFTALIEPVLFREKFRKVDLLIAAMVLTGVAVMTPTLDFNNNVTMGIGLGVISGLFFMSRNLLVRKYVKQYTGSTLMFWQILVTAIVLSPILFILNPPAYEMNHVHKLLWLGIVFTALPQTLYAASLKHLTAKTVAVLATLLPFYGAAMGYLIHDETVTVRTAIGGAIILSCIIYETVINVKR